MKALNELFKHFNSSIGYSLALFDENKNLLIATENNDAKFLEYHFTYSIKLQGNDELYLASKDRLGLEVWKLLELLIIQTYNQNSYSREELLISLLKGQYDPLLLKRAKQQLMKASDLYRLILLKGEENIDMTDTLQLLNVAFKGDQRVISVEMDYGIVLFVAGDSHNPIALANQIRDTINAELLIDIKITISRGYDKLQDIYEAFKETMEVIEIGKVFFPGEHVLNTENIKLERLIYSIPYKERRKIYIENFKKDLYDKMEEDLVYTMEVLLNSDLNLGEAAGKLYIHRNTLNYRLDKFYRDTGLDLRKFNDAMFFKLSWLLRKSIT
ncbi:PucR family transcriptional regulator [Alkaliphilus serpentinus]|uniref:PucR C-terminal helix-turn-helix domain-containing protein n=1 Tax=Alkaliphilus serpentinus TaxID=1482731 RepID=A0A833HMR2_9FIRM|nr:helix-turn-helix domain-containing protein [Alkaliphilus serpentinus]KAB3528810.1 hypothetical protein F8153_10825 [Alkaliphilus serpentinus]